MSDAFETPGPETAQEPEAAESPQPLARPVELPELAPQPARAGTRSIDLLLDVELPITVELGQSRMPIQQILELGVGSIIPLDKAAGDPVDLLVNGRIVARGEVVVVDEHFGVRILGLVDPDQRLGSHS